MEKITPKQFWTAFANRAMLVLLILAVALWVWSFFDSGLRP
jgi:hypothetical protein